MTAKLIMNGKVAVLISRGYGAGWSSWAEGGPGHTKEELMFSPALVSCILDGASPQEVELTAQMMFPNQYPGGLSGLVVEWVPIGTRFRVVEYDGAERIVYVDDEAVVA